MTRYTKSKMNTTYSIGTMVTFKDPYIYGISKVEPPFEIGIITKVFIADDDFLTPVYQVYLICARTYSVIPSEMLWPVDPLLY